MIFSWIPSADAARASLGTLLAAVPYVGALLALLNNAYWDIIRGDIAARAVNGQVLIRVKRWGILFVSWHAIEVGPPSHVDFKPAGQRDPDSF